MSTADQAESTPTQWEKHGIFRLPAGTALAPHHPVESRERFYGFVSRGIAKILAAQGVTVTIRGLENVPVDGGALYAINHTGYLDFIFAGIPSWVKARRLVRFMAKKEIFTTKGVGALMRAMQHISVDRSAGRGSLEEAVKRLQEGQLVGIFPESTISRSFLIREELKTGAARIADAAGVPLIPMIVFGSHRMWTKDQKRNMGRSNTPILIHVGTPLPLTGDPDADTLELKKTLDSMLDTAITEYKELCGPVEGKPFWLPARYGGTAPTPEQARSRHQKELADKRRKREQKLDRSIEKKAARAMEKLTPRGRTVSAKIRRFFKRLINR